MYSLHVDIPSLVVQQLDSVDVTIMVWDELKYYHVLVCHHTSGDMTMYHTVNVVPPHQCTHNNTISYIHNNTYKWTSVYTRLLVHQVGQYTIKLAGKPLRKIDQYNMEKTIKKL